MATLRSEARATVGDVKEIFHSTDLSDDAIIHRINTASYLVDEIADADSTLPADRLTLIEMNIAAAALTTVDPYESEEDHESYGATFDRESSYWETALMLDSTNTLSSAKESTPTLSISTPDVRGIR